MLWRILPAVLLLATTGCVMDEMTPLVPEHNLVNRPVTLPKRQLTLSPATGEAATRAATVGQKLVQANPQMGLEPLFVTIGSPEAEVFHQGLNQVTITEGLVKQCTTEGQLAAVLALELAKMVAEREALAPPETRAPKSYQQPLGLTGIGSSGPGGSSDHTELAEMAKLGADRRRPGPPPPPPDTKLMARNYLAKAGFAAREMEGAAPILRSAEENATLEKQMNGSTKVPLAPPSTLP